jgi:hypothetical protein
MGKLVYRYGVVLSFDVIRAEHVACRASVIRHRSRMLRAFEAAAGGGSGGGGGGKEGGGGEGVLRDLWRSFSLSLLSNLG